jgi:phospholipase D1/2
MGDDALKGIYGMSDNVILYWAHHEKLCLIDGKISFMGGLDLCFGRWDTNQHSIADVHPNDLNATVFPGQDYNNARIMDFSDVANPDQNKLDRRQYSRMGWSDISVSLHGPCVQDLRLHFVERWNFIYDEKYNVRKDARYSKLSLTSPSGGQQPLGGQSSPQGAGQTYPYQHQAQLQPQYNTLQPQPSNPSSITTSTSRPNSSYSNNPPQFQPPPGNTPTPQSSWQGSAPPPPGSTISPQPSWQSSAPPPHLPGSAALSPPSWHSAPPPQPQTQPAYQQQQQQNPYGLPVPSWQASSQSQPPPPAAHPSQTQPHTAQPSYFGGVEGEQHFPPPPPGGPPSISSPPPQQTGSYGHETPTQSQENFAAAELPARATGQRSSYAPYSTTAQNVPPNQQSYVPYSTQAQSFPPPPQQQSRGFDENPDYYDEGGEGEKGFRGKTARYRDEGHRLGSELTGITNLISDGVETKLRHVQGKKLGGTDQYGRPLAQDPSVMQCQIVRSCTKWSAGIPTEHSIQDAYISAIENSRHFVYIENQFFITATGDKQEPVYNQIGKALVDRILRAARAGDKYKVIVVIPSVPGFAGNLRDDSALGTRAIMEFQYNSINRGGHSIMELIAQAGFNPMDYIRFYNLRNYDRLNVNNSLLRAEQQSGVNYEDARKQNDDALGAGTYGSGTATSAYNPGQQYQQYQQAAQQVAATKPHSIASGRWDSVSECYMLGGEDLRNVPWDQPGELSEIDAFVSEELYIHSKVRRNSVGPES